MGADGFSKFVCGIYFKEWEMNTEYQKLADKLSKLALEANAVVLQMEQLKQAFDDGKPKVRQDYWRLSELNNIYGSSWNNDAVENTLWNAGNVYLTEQAAKNARDFKLAVVRINREIVRLNKLEGWVADFTNFEVLKWFPFFDCNVKKWQPSNTGCCIFQFDFAYSSSQTIKSVLKSHAADFDIVQKCGAV